MIDRLIVRILQLIGENKRNFRLNKKLITNRVLFGLTAEILQSCILMTNLLILSVLVSTTPFQLNNDYMNSRQTWFIEESNQTVRDYSDKLSRKEINKSSKRCNQRKKKLRLITIVNTRKEIPKTQGALHNFPEVLKKVEIRMLKNKPNCSRRLSYRLKCFRAKRQEHLM